MALMKPWLSDGCRNPKEGFTRGWKSSNQRGSEDREQVDVSPGEWLGDMIPGGEFKAPEV